MLRTRQRASSCLRGVEADATQRRARGRAIRLRAPRCGVSDTRDGAAGKSVARQSHRSRRDLFLVWAGILLSSSVEPSTALADGDDGGDPATVQPGAVAFEPQVRNSDIAVFIAGVIPFVWATGEFWRRVLKGEVFGTGKDRVIFDQSFNDNASSASGGRKLTSTALSAAYGLFAIAGVSLALALVAFVQAGSS